MRPALPPLLALVLNAGLAVAAHAPIGRCVGPPPALGIVAVGAGSPDETFYVDDRNLPLGDGVWIYAETNGIWQGHDPSHDLQRGGQVCHYDCVPFVLPHADRCVDDRTVIPDWIVFAMGRA